RRSAFGPAQPDFERRFRKGNRFTKAHPYSRPKEFRVMPQNASRLPGRHFLQIPGPTPVPDRVMRAIDMPLIDQRGPEFAKLGKRVLEGIKTIFKTAQPVII